MVKTIKKAFILVVGITTCGFFQAVNAGGTGPNIVISLQSNPMSDPERACLAVTMGRMLSGGGSANVSLFVTLDGVLLADESVVSSPRFKCDVPLVPPMDTDGIIDGVMSLQDNLEEYMGVSQGEPEMLVCPLCWGSRYGEEEPDYGELGSPKLLIMNADKILDF